MLTILRCHPLSINSKRKRLKADDLPHPLVVKVREVVMETLGGEGGDVKPVVYFVNQDKQLALNKTNAEQIINITGVDETSQWVTRGSGRTVPHRPEEGGVFPLLRLPVLRLAEILLLGEPQAGPLSVRGESLRPFGQ